MWYSDIDQHKRDSVITTYGPEGPRVKQTKVANTPLTLARYFGEFPGPHRAIVESTGGWYWLADALEPLGVELILAHATRLKAISAAKVKTDQVDSDVLALLLRADLIPVAHMIRADQRGPRDLMRARLRLVEKSVSAQNSLARLLEKFNVQTVAELDALYQLQAGCHAAQIQLLDEQITTLERALHPHLLPNEDVQRLLWIPGIGKVNAFTLYTEIDGIARFPSDRQFFSYSRLVPGADNSGGRTRHRSGSKAGNRYLKLAFSHAGIRAVQYHPEIRAFFKSQGSAEADPGRPHPRGPRVGAHRVSGAHQAGGFQRAVQAPPAQSSETRAVAAPGKPTRLTDSLAGVTRLIGKPGVVPMKDLGPSRREATARAQRPRVGEPIMVFGRHRA